MLPTKIGNRIGMFQEDIGPTFGQSRLPNVNGPTFTQRWPMVYSTVTGLPLNIMDKMEGQVYGDYKLGKLIGKGTYGYVYRARRILENGRATSTVFAVGTMYII